MILKLKLTPGIYLVGFMGCGKSTVGRALADELGWSFFDLDEDIEKAAGCTIAHIFETNGEAAFRELETAALKQRVANVRSGRPQVIALGGGAFSTGENFDLAFNHGITIWLDTPYELIECRVAAETHRPLACDPLRMRHLYEARRDDYSRSDFRIEPLDDNPAKIVARILELPLFTP
ncbi:MAG TPA: shikimate kinase [Bryobacteraceae bacterium]|nr:shikimate kinase [Bryobacteraceae bacterium]